MATLDGLDALVFTGGIGEHAADVRASACKGLAHMGIAKVPVLVIPTKEDWCMAHKIMGLYGTI